ncbi:hypothetical protein [Spirillospora albida]|uniref:hypothetical protein n=1 Tax=Spirillospora albida TaxID=58123 RepID=UPI0004BF9D62|nr:hypothetical protein [Spirillospora albida]
MTRTDLLSLTPDALAALANRGLVKRAAKDLAAGQGPGITVDPDGGVHGDYPDGTRASLPAGAGLEAATCTCAATGTCRHQLCLVLAYQERPPGESVPESAGAAVPDSAGAAGPDPAGTAVPDSAGSAGAWSPGAFDDDALTAVLGQRALTAARRTFRAGYAARVRRPSGGDPVAQVDLPSCTVRFLVPGELGYVHTDAAAGRRAAVIVLAVWAFRAADERGLDGADVSLDIGGTGREPDGLDDVLDLADEILLEGAVHAGPVLATGLRRAVPDLAGRGLHWPAGAVDDLAGQLAAHHARHAEYAPERLAALLAELHARHRATGARSQVLGTSESAETPLRQVRLVALGCRVGGTARARTADVFLAHAAAGTVLVLKRRFDVPEGARATGADIASRRLLGTTLGDIAAGNVVSESATRSARRVVRVTAGRIARTSVTPLGDAWTGLPDGLLVRDLKAEERVLDALPPRLVRPRVEAELVRVVEIGEVREIGYHPGAQRLDAVVADACGVTAVVSAEYSPHAPAALDALAGALAASPRLVSGAVRRGRGGLVIDPFAVLAPDGVVVPDLAPGDGAEALDGASGAAADPLTEVLDAALAVCAEAAHRGLRHATPALRDRVSAAADDLARAGFAATAADLARFAAALGTDGATRAWADAAIRLITTAELR